MRLLPLVWLGTLSHALTYVALRPDEQPRSVLDASCEGNFRGTIGTVAIWSLEDSCAVGAAASVGAATGIEDENGVRVVAVTRPELDPEIFGARSPDWSKSLQSSLKKWSALKEASGQIVLGSTYFSPAMLLQLDELQLWAVHESDLSLVDAMFPSIAHLTLLSSSAGSPRKLNDSRLEALFPLQFSSTINQLVDASLRVDQLQKDVTWLTGEEALSPIYSRHSVSEGARDAAQYIQHELSLAGGNCTLHHFQAGFAPNVVCHFPPSKAFSSNTSEHVLVSAHYDSRGTFGNINAPGADDDASGTAALLSIGRALSQSAVQLRRPVMLVAFAGEEQGLVGSRALAKSFRQTETDIVFALQMDMLAYRAPDEPLSIGFPDKIGSPVARELVMSAARLYKPNLRVGLTPACCSDHQSFHEEGFSATWVFERPGPIADPKYHNSGDKSDREGCKRLGTVLFFPKLTVIL